MSFRILYCFSRTRLV